MSCVNSILVPIDFSKDSRLAWEAADAQAEQWAGGVILLHVKDPRKDVASQVTFHYAALKRWSRFVRRIPEDRMAYVYCAGNPAEEILRIAEQFRPRAIIMGRGGDLHSPGHVVRQVMTGFPGPVGMVSGSTPSASRRAA
jgi:nucleotide-binding universal stress UspA family protein